MNFLKILFAVFQLTTARSLSRNWNEMRNTNLDSRNMEFIRQKLQEPALRRVIMDQVHQRRLGNVRSFRRQMHLMERRSPEFYDYRY